jgi:hypothetical protein
MEIKSWHDFCSEFYTVAMSIEVVVMFKDEPVTIKIDAVKNERTGIYSTNAYQKVSVTLQPTYPKSGDSFDRQPEDFCIWVIFDLPWTNRNSAEEALNQALGFLKERSSV